MTSQSVDFYSMETILRQIKYEDDFSEDDIDLLKKCYEGSGSTLIRASSIGKVLREVLAACSNLNSRKNIIKIGLSASKTCLKEVLTSIRSILETCDFSNSSMRVESELSEGLRICLGILESLVTLLSSIREAPLDVQYVMGLPCCIGLVLLDVFRHCKDSEILYSSYFKQIGSDITNVFKKCSELQTLFFEVLTEHIHFDLSQEEQLNILLEVLDVIVDIGEVVISLDVKTMAEEWKGYSKLCEQHADWLRDKFVHHKAMLILCREIQNNLSSVVNNEMRDDKNLIRNLKVSNFIIKILIKLSEVFCGYLSTDMRPLVDLFLTIHQHSPPVLLHSGLPPSVVEGIRSHITVGGEPLLLNLLPDPHFRNSYRQQMKVFSACESYALGRLLLHVTVMRSLLQLPGDVRETWLEEEDDNNVLCCLFHILPSCYTDLNKNLKFCNGGDENISLYDLTLMHGAALAISCSDLAVLEKRMLAAVLDTDVWGALLAVDLWSIIARYGSSEFRFDQVVYLIQAFNAHKHSAFRDMPQNINLSHLLSILFGLLPDKSKAQLLTKFPVLEFSEAWTAIGLDDLPDDQGYVLATVLDSCCNVMKQFLDKRKYSEADYKIMMAHLSLVSTVSEEKLSENHSEKASVMVGLAMQAWRCLVFSDKLEKTLSSKEASVPGCQWINNYLVTLSEFTMKLQHLFTNENWAKILHIISKLLPKSQSTIKIATLGLLKSLAFYNIAEDSHKETMITLIASLFRDLLEDTEPLIHILSLEIFAHFTRNTSTETIISQTVYGRKELKQKVAHFFSEKLPTGSAISVQEFYEKNPPADFIHKCEKDNINFSPDADFLLGDLDEIFCNSGDSGPNKKPKIDTSSSHEITTLINRLSLDIRHLKELCTDKTMADEHRKTLLSVNAILTDLTN